MLLSCGATKSVFDSKDISILKSSMQTIHPGVRGAPSSVNYKIEVKIEKKGITAFGNAQIFNKKGEEALWMDEIRVLKNKQLYKGESLQKGDVLDLYVSRLIFHESEEFTEEKSSFIPLENPEKAELLLIYYKGDKKKVVGLKGILVEETIYAP